jgi:hypothetical protein
VNSQGVIHDSTKNWTPNQWVGYSIRNMNPTARCYLKSSFVRSNTSNTITYAFYPTTDRGPLIVFNAGDAYDIHRVLAALDQPGRGKGDQISGRPVPINVVTGTKQWPHQIVEPSMSWNNIHSPTGHVYGFGNWNAPTCLPNRDFFNLGAGFPPDTTPSAVSSHYTAAINGVDYVGPFVYPHPLVTGQPAPSPTPTPTSRQHLHKEKTGAKRSKKTKKEKAKKGPQKSANQTVERLVPRRHLVNADAVAAALCAVRDTRLRTMQTPTEAWLQHLLGRFYFGRT